MISINSLKTISNHERIHPPEIPNDGIEFIEKLRRAVDVYNNFFRKSNNFFEVMR